MVVRRHRLNPKVTRLQQVPGFGGISAEALVNVVRLVDESRIDAGALLTRQGYVGRECFLVLSGRAGVHVDGARVATAGPGDFVGEMGLLASRPRTATVRADTPMEVFVIGPEAFGALLDIEAVTQHMLVGMSARLAAVENAEAVGRAQLSGAAVEVDREP